MTDAERELRELTSFLAGFTSDQYKQFICRLLSWHERHSKPTATEKFNKAIGEIIELTKPKPTPTIEELPESGLSYHPADIELVSKLNEVIRNLVRLERLLKEKGVI